MFEPNKDEFDKNLRKAVEEDNFVEKIKGYGVPRHIVRQLIRQYGVETTEFYKELWRLGYAVPLTDTTSKK